MSARAIPPGRIDPLPAMISFLAGMTGLSLEILWTRLLAIETGGPLASFVIVVCGVTGGLAAGAALFGRRAPEGSASMRRLAWLQTALALSGFASALAAPMAPIRALLTMLGLDPAGYVFVATQAIAGGTAVFLPAVLMGGTLPLLIAAEGVSPSLGRRCGWLVGANAAGASAGALLSGFALLPFLGLRGSLLATAAAGLLPAALAAIRSRTSAVSLNDAPIRAAASFPQPARPMAMSVMLLLGAGGLATTALETVWARLTSLSFGSSTQAASLVLAAVIAALAVGGWLGGRLAGGRFAPERAFGAMLLAGAAGAMAVEPLMERLPLVVAAMAPLLFPPAASPGGVAVLLQFMLTFLLTAPACLPLGALLPLATESLARALPAPGLTASRRAALAGQASAALSVGTFLGAPAALAALSAGAGSRGALLGAAFLLSSAALLRPASPLRDRIAALVLLAGASARGALGGWDPAVMSSGPYLYAPLYSLSADAREGGGLEAIRRAVHARGAVLDQIEGTGALVTVRMLHGGTLSMQVNGKTDASTAGDLRMQSMTAHLPLLLRESAEDPASPAPPRVLIVGLGSGVTLGAALTHAVDSVEVVEISPEVARAARQFASANRGALSDPRARLTIADARARLLFAAPGRGATWEIIASQPSNPWISGQAVLFTREFFTLARSRLAPSGLMCQWLQGHGLEVRDFKSIVATFASVFPHTLLWEESTAGGDYLLIGSGTPLRLDPGRLRLAMAEPAVAADLAALELSHPEQIVSLIASAGPAMAAFGAGAPLQSEDRLALEFTAPDALRKETLPAILRALEPHRVDPVSLMTGDPPLALAVSRLRRAARREREWAEALGLHRSGRADDPELMTAMSYLRAGMGRAAALHIEGLLRRRPSERFPRLVLAHLLMAEGKAELALAELAAAVSLDPDDPWGWLLLARAQHATGRLAEALASSRMAESRGQLPASGWSDRCALLLAAGDLPSAEAACLEALSLDSDLPEARVNLGVLQSRRGRAGDAERSYRRALELDPGLVDARVNLASLLGRAGRPREGLAQLEPLLAPDASDAELHRLAGWLNLEAGDLPAARRCLEASRRLDPHNQEGLALAAALEKQKNGTGAGAQSN